jgi:hypothetical protein
MDANEALEAIRTLARVALSMADEGLSLETLAEQYQRSLPNLTPPLNGSSASSTTAALPRLGSG